MTRPGRFPRAGRSSRRDTARRAGPARRTRTGPATGAAIPAISPAAAGIRVGTGTSATGTPAGIRTTGPAGIRTTRVVTRTSRAAIRTTRAATGTSAVAAAPVGTPTNGAGRPRPPARPAQETDWSGWEQGGGPKPKKRHRGLKILAIVVVVLVVLAV